MKYPHLLLILILAALLAPNSYGAKLSELTASDGTVADTDEMIINDYSEAPVTRRIDVSQLFSYSANTLDTEWDTAAEINAATTDDDFATLTGMQTIQNKFFIPGSIGSSALVLGDLDASFDSTRVAIDFFYNVGGSGSGGSLMPPNELGGYAWTLPAGTGTLALTSDINTDTLTGTLPNYRVGKQTIDTALAPQFTTGAFTSLDPTIARVSVTGAWPIAAGMVEDMHSDLYTPADEFTWVVEYHRSPYIVTDVTDLDNVGGTTTATATTEFEHGFSVSDTVIIDSSDNNLDGTFTIASVPTDTTFTFDSSYGTDVTDATGTVRESRDYTVASVGNFWASNECGYLIRVTEGDELEVVHYGTANTHTITTNLTDHIEPGDSGIFAVRKSGTTLEILGPNLQVLSTGTVDAEVEQITSSSGSATILYTMLGGYYDENDADAWPQDVWRGTLIETYAWQSALSDAQLRAGMNEWQARNAYSIDLTKDARNPIITRSHIQAATEGIAQHIVYNSPIRISDNNYLLFYGSSEAPGNTHIAVAHSNDSDTWRFPILGLEEIDTGDGFLNNLVESKDAFQDAIEDPTDSDQWLLLSEANDGGSAAALLTLPKDFSAGGTDTGDLTSSAEVKTIWDWQDTGRLGYVVKTSTLAIDGTGAPFTTRTMRLQVKDTTDYTGAASSFGNFPEFTSWLQEQDFYGVKIIPWGDYWLGTATIYNQFSQRIEGFGLYISEDGATWEQIMPWALQVSETPGDFDYGQLLVSKPVEKPNGDLLFPYTGFTELHDASPKYGELGYATLPRAALDRAVANKLDHSALTNRKQRCHFGGTGQYVTLSGDIALTGAFDLAFTLVYDSATNRQKIIGHTTGEGTLQGEPISDRFYLRNDAGSSTTLSYAATHGDFQADTAYHIRITRDGSGNLDLWVNGVDQSVGNALTGTITFNAIGNGKGSTGFGGDTLSRSISDITIDIGDDGTVNHTFIGNRNDAAGWADQTGSLTATVPNDLALLTYLLGNQDAGIKAP